MRLHDFTKNQIEAAKSLKKISNADIGKKIGTSGQYASALINKSVRLKNVNTEEKEKAIVKMLEPELSKIASLERCA